MLQRKLHCGAVSLNTRKCFVATPLASTPTWRPAQQQPLLTNTVSSHKAHRRQLPGLVQAVEVPIDLSSSSSGKTVDYTDAWYPINFAADLFKDKPNRFELLQNPLVIWWDPNASAWRAMDDLCPHRLVPLSEGRINLKGQLECGYHGWAFNGDGKCDRIPQGGNPENARACVTAYPCEERQGLVWVKPQRLPNPLSPGATPMPVIDVDRIPIIPELEDPAWATQDTWRDLPYDYMTLMENVIDSSHVPFTHHVSMSNRNKIGDFKISMSSPISEDGFSGHWPTGPRAGQLGPQTTEFVSPCYLKHTLEASEKRGFTALTVVYAVPMSPGKCRVINRNCTRFAKGGLPQVILKNLPTWVSHVNSHTLLEDDQIFLHIGEEEFIRRKLQRSSTSPSSYYLASPADTLIAAFRSWLDKHGGGGPWGPISQEMLSAIGPRQTRDQLLDRYHQHTEQCATCTKVLAQFRSAIKAVTAVRAGCSVLAIFCGAVAVAHAGVGAPAAGAAAASISTGAAAGGVSAVLAGIASALLSVGQFVVGAASPADQVMRGLVWAAAALFCNLVLGVLRKQEAGFVTGVYPPPRNLAKDP